MKFNAALQVDGLTGIMGAGATEEEAMKDASRWCDTTEGLIVTLVEADVDSIEDVTADTEYTEAN